MVQGLSGSFCVDLKADHRSVFLVPVIIAREIPPPFIQPAETSISPQGPMNFIPMQITPSHRAVHQLWAILQRLRQMGGFDLLAPRQIGNRARQFQDAMIGARR